MQFVIRENTVVAPGVLKMTLEGDTSAIRAPGQFVNVQLPGFFLRRPISVCDWGAGELVLIYKVVGRGTREMSAYAPGQALDLLTGLGNGYDLSVPTRRPLLLGGGVGVPPLYALCKALVHVGLRPHVCLGFNAEQEVFLEAEFRALGALVTVCTADGSYGQRGFVTAPMADIQYDHFFACGPEPMLKAVFTASGDVPGQLSFEERMACGFGACMGCSCQTTLGSKRICKEGPVLRKEEIVWRS